MIIGILCVIAVLNLICAMFTETTYNNGVVVRTY